MNVNFYVIASAVDYDVGAGDPLITGNQFKGMNSKVSMIIILEIF